MKQQKFGISKNGEVSVSYGQDIEETEDGDVDKKLIKDITDEEWQQIESPMYILLLGMALVAGIIDTLFKNLIVILLLIVTKRVDKKLIKEKLTKIDFIKTQDYYREIINEYSMGELAYIDNFKISYPRTMIAEMLQLEKDKKIKLENGKIEICENANLTKLNQTQIYIIKHIKNGKLKNIEKFELEEKIKQDALNNNLIEAKNDLKKQMIKKVISSIIIFVLMCLTLDRLTQINTENETLKFIILLIILSGVIAVVIYPIYEIFFYIVYMSKYKKDPYFRTKKGNKLNEKIEGLKQYLKDYSLLDEKRKEELVLWEDYLSYSVLFGQNKKIIEEYEKYIEN